LAKVISLAVHEVKATLAGLPMKTFGVIFHLDYGVDEKCEQALRTIKQIKGMEQDCFRGRICCP